MVVISPKFCFFYTKDMFECYFSTLSYKYLEGLMVVFTDSGKACNRDGACH